MSASTAESVVVAMTFKKDTKNKVVFEEALTGGPLDVEKLGTLYVPKTTAAALGWQQGDELEVELRVKPS